MKQKIIYLVLLLTFSALVGVSSLTAVAQLAVTATATNGTCVSNAKITAAATGNTGSVNYQLLQGATIIRAYQASNIFDNLPVGSYTVKVEDAANNTATSNAVTLTTSYVAMAVSIPTTQVNCATATNGSLTVTVANGRAPYTYSISPNVGTQSGNVFSNLPVGSYTISVTDACGTTVTQGSSVSSISTTVKDIQPAYGGAFFSWGNYQNVEYNNCASGAFVNIYAWAYKATNGTISSFDRSHFYWRYEYPSGSGNLYGVGGVLNGAMIPLTTGSVPAPATATYPFGDGDIIIYDECGNSFRSVKNLWQSTATSTPQQGTGNMARPFFDCINGGGVTMQFTQYQTICAPVTYTFTDNATAAVITQVVTDNNRIIKYGFVPGHTYTVKALDALGHNATTTTSVTIPSSVGNLTIQTLLKSNSYANAYNVTMIFPVEIPANTPITYEVTASNNAAIPVGYTRTYSFPTSVQTVVNLPGHSSYTGTNWPTGTYTLKFNSAPCLVDKYLTFVIPVGNNGSFNSTNNITPVCGAFNVSLNGVLDNPSSYNVKIISGPSNVNASRGFNTTAVSAGVYSSLPFDGLSYGTYNIGLFINGGTGTPIATQTITYDATNALVINALATGGYTCSGSPTGSLVITATSGSGSSLEYSKDDGATWQTSNTFSGVAVGTYPVKVKDACGNITSYNASVVAATAIAASASPSPICEGQNLQLGVNAVGATSYSWTGPNGFTSSLQNPIINNATVAASGIYTVTVTSPSCVNTTAVSVTINPLPTATINYATASFCATGTAVPTITGTTGGTFSSTSGLVIDANTGEINLATSNAGTYVVTYAFSDGTPCSNTTTATVVIKQLPLLVTTAQSTCAPGNVDLTAAAVTTGSTAGQTFTYFTDANGTTPLANPTAINTSGTYYIQGYLAATGCYSKITAVTVTVQAKPNLVVANPTPVCSGTVDLTAAAITLGSDANLSFAYYTNAAGTTTLSNPSAIATSGTYYIQATSTVTGCVSDIKPVTVNFSSLSAPVVTATQPTCATATGSITISAVAGNTYSVDGGTYSATLTYTGLTSGAHTVLAKNADGCISSPTNITINNALAAPVAPIVAITQPTCATATGSITISAVVGNTYSVDGGAYSATLTYTGLTSGAHTVLAKNADGCISSPTNITINNALATPVAPIVAITQPTCATATGSITISAVAGNTYSVDGGAYSATLTYAGLTSGAHTVLAKNADGCISLPTNITINAQPTTPTAAISYGSNPFQATGVLTVTRTGQAGGTYNAIPTGLSINASTGAIDLSKSTPNQTYTVTYSFSNGSCSATTSTTVVVNSTPAVISYSKVAFCATGSATVTQTGPASGTYTSNNNGLKINASNGAINLATSTPGSYVVTYTYQDGTLTATANTNITVNAMPVVTLNSSGGLSISKGDIVKLTATGGVTYNWTGADILSGQNTNVLEVRPKTTTTYTVTATNGSGCSEVMQITIDVKEDVKLIPNNVITPNGDDKNDFWVVRNIDYYPNNKVSIYDRAGRRVYAATGYKNDWNGTYNGMPLAEGAYIYVIDMGKGFSLLRGTINIIRDQK